MTRIAEPVLDALSKGELKKRLPIHDWEKHREAYTHYEAFARTLAGIALWLELGPDGTEEGRLRERFIKLAQQSLINATDPTSPDFLNFGQVSDQPYVDSAYLRIEQGQPHDRIVSLASDENFHLIVMGTHGRTGRPLALVGSVAESVVRTSPRPVLTVREVVKAGP